MVSVSEGSRPFCLMETTNVGGDSSDLNTFVNP